MTRFNKDPELEVCREEPFNAAPPLPRLREAFVTPEPLFFVRNHAPVPEVEAGSYRLHVGGLVNQPLELTLAELRDGFAPRTVTATLQCAGNRRRELMAVRPIPGEVAWTEGAIGNAVWRGVALAAVLHEAGLASGARHVAFAGLDRVDRDGQVVPFGGSVPLEKALQPEVLLAYELNGEPLPPAHGFPLRALVPGYIGARSVKWLERIEVRERPSDNPYQQRSYKLFPPDVTAGGADWSRGIMLGELPVNSVICSPLAGAELAAGPVEVTGYALTSGGRTVERVDVSADGGASWTPAALEPGNGPWAWRFWRVRLELSPGSCELVARAWDSAASSQPRDVESLWNFKGYMNSAWHRVAIRVSEAWSPGRNKE